MNRFLPIFLLIVLNFAGCAWFQAKEEKPAHELAREGMEAFNNGKYRKSLEYFEKLKDWYPFSKYAILAELKVADAHYKLKAYEEAVFAYEEFENLHPRNEATPYVVYQIGRCYFEQIDTVDRDQTAARKALEAFTRLKAQFPEDDFARKSDQHIKICLKNLAEHEFYIGYHYYKAKHYRAALNRFKMIITEYPDVGVHQKVLRYITLCEAALKNEPKKQ